MPTGPAGLRDRDFMRETLMTEVKTYTIGDTLYEQRELVLGQWKQLRALLEGLEIPGGVSALGGLLAALEESGRLERALAVLLTESGGRPQEKNLERTAAALEFAITPQQIAQVIEDFFTCNPAASILSQLGTIIVTLAALAQAAIREIGSRRSAFCFAPETTAGEPPCSGDAPPPEPVPGSSIASEI